MDAAPSRHPTEQTLRDFGLGKLDDRLAEAISKHLDVCPDCHKRVAETSADSFLGRIRETKKSVEKAASSPTHATGTLSYHAPPAAAPLPAISLPPALAEHPDYQIKKEIGRGGMGVVYLAHNTLMGRDEVLKVMGRHIMDRPGIVDRFLREIRAVARLRHPNIVTAYAATRAGDSIVFAMEYVEGLDLARMVASKGPLPIAHACYFVYQAALGLQHAHEEGLVHRDIKPANLMLSRKGDRATVKVLDFGLAKVAREHKIEGGLTSMGQALGTPDYIAPEQILDAQSADIRADIYSLGATLYFLLSRRPPFQADSLYDLYQAHISRDADPLNLVRPEVPTELAALVSKMMAKDAARRFQTPGEVAEALKPFFKSSGAGPKAPRPDVSQGTQPDLSRSPARTDRERGQPASDTMKPADVLATGSQWEGLIDLREEEPASLPSLTSRPTGRPPGRRWPIALAASLFGLVALGIIITIRDQSGRETTRISVPDGSTATIEESSRGNGNAQKEATAPPDSKLALKQAYYTATDEENRVILAKLEQAIPMKYPRETALELVLNDIRKATAGPDGTGIPIYVDPVGMQEAEKSMKSPIVINVEGIPLKTTLGLVLKQLGLDYCVVAGVLVIGCSEPEYPLAEVVAEATRRTISDGSPESAAVTAKLGAPIPMRFAKETPLASVCKYITDTTCGPDSPGIPVFVDPNGLREAEKTLQSPMVIDLEEVPLRTTLQLMLSQLGLTYYVEKGLLMITANTDEFVPEAVIKQAEKNKPVPKRFDALLASVAPGLKLSARAIGPFKRSWPTLRTHLGRENVLRTQPVSASVPFVMSCPVEVPAGQKTTLFLEVSCSLGDWNVVVKVNNRTLHDSIISEATTKDGWATVEVDLTAFAGNTVNLELLDKPNNVDEGGERAYWGRIEIVSEAVTSAMLRNLPGNVGAKVQNRARAYEDPLPRPDVALETLAPAKATTGWGKVLMNQTAGGWPISLGGKAYAKGVGVHANSELVYDLKPEYDRFVGRVGIDDKMRGEGNAIAVKVFVGGQVLAVSPLIREGGSPWPLNVELPKDSKGRASGQLRLVVDATEDGIDSDVTDWVDAGFVVDSRLAHGTAPKEVPGPLGSAGKVGAADRAQNVPGQPPAADASTAKKAARPQPERTKQPSGRKAASVCKRSVKPALPRLLPSWVGPVPPTQESAHGTSQGPRPRIHVATTPAKAGAQRVVDPHLLRA